MSVTYAEEFVVSATVIGSEIACVSDCNVGLSVWRGFNSSGYAAFDWE
jgi:hypothetical protein